MDTVVVQNSSDGGLFNITTNQRCFSYLEFMKNDITFLVPGEIFADQLWATIHDL